MFMCDTSPEDDILHIKGVFDDTRGWHSDSKDVLKVGYVRGLCDSVQFTEIADEMIRK